MELVVQHLAGGSTPPAPRVTVENQPLVIAPEQSGLVTQDTSVGLVTLEVPANSILAGGTFSVTAEPLALANNYFVVNGTKLIGDFFYDISAQDASGTFIHTFLNSIKITLPVPKKFIGAKNLGVYWLNETNWQWVLIPDVVFANGKVTFDVKHLSRFAIFQTIGTEVKGSKKIAPRLSLPLNKKTTVKNVIPVVTSSADKKSNQNTVPAPASLSSLTLIFERILNFFKNFWR